MAVDVDKLEVELVGVELSLGFGTTAAATEEEGGSAAAEEILMEGFSDSVEDFDGISFFMS